MAFDTDRGHVSYWHTSLAVAELRCCIVDISRLEKDLAAIDNTLERNMRNIAQELGIPLEETNNDPLQT